MVKIAELTGKINAATSAIQKLEGTGHGGAREIKLTVLRSLYGSIQEARVRGVSLDALAKTITSTVEMKISVATLRKYLLLLKVEEETAVQNMSKKLAEQFKKS